MTKFDFGACPVFAINNMFAVVVILSGALRLECNGCLNQFSLPT